MEISNLLRFIVQNFFSDAKVQRTSICEIPETESIIQASPSIGQDTASYAGTAYTYFSSFAFNYFWFYWNFPKLAREKRH